MTLDKHISLSNHDTLLIRRPKADTGNQILSEHKRLFINIKDV